MPALEAITLKPMPELPAALVAETEAYALLRQVAFYFAQANPTPKLITDTRAEVSDYLERYAIRAPQQPPELPLMNLYRIDYVMHGFAWTIRLEAADETEARAILKRDYPEAEGCTVSLAMEIPHPES